MMHFWEWFYSAISSHGRLDHDLDEALRATKNLSKIVRENAEASIGGLAQELDDDTEHHS
jgi:hypothetical protein